MKQMTPEQAKKSMHQNALRAMEKAVLIIEADSKMLCPVLSGTLKRSITHDVIESNNKIVGVVGTPVEYAYWAGKHKPYLEPAFDENITQIKQIFMDELSKV